MRTKLIGVLLATATCLSPLGIAGSFLSPAQLMTEVMIENQGNTATLLGYQFGAAPGSPLTFTSFVDPLGFGFTYSLVAGSTYNGEPITLNASAVFNPTTLVCEVTSTGSVGDVQWTVSGVHNITLQPDLVMDNASLLFESDLRQITAVIIVTAVRPNYTSADFGYLNDSHGIYIPGSDFLSSDTISHAAAPTRIAFEQTAPGIPLAVLTEGESSYLGGAGFFTTTVTVPAPALPIWTVATWWTLGPRRARSRETR